MNSPTLQNSEKVFFFGRAWKYILPITKPHQGYEWKELKTGSWVLVAHGGGGNPSYLRA
jgi:hypothetical protein